MTAAPKPKNRRIHISVQIADHDGSYTQISLGRAELDAQLPVSLRTLMAQVEAQVRQVAGNVVALHGPITPPVETPAPADVSLGDDGPGDPLQQHELDDLPF